jgi:hypothetical protein
MTPHVSLRLLAALLALTTLVLRSPPPVAAQSVNATRPTPSLQERLDRLAAEIDRNRVDLHVPGAALAIVRGDEVIVARGFGFADVKRKTAMTPSTPWANVILGSLEDVLPASSQGLRPMQAWTAVGKELVIRRGKMGQHVRVPDSGAIVELAIKAIPPLTDALGPRRFRVVRNGDSAMVTHV